MERKRFLSLILSAIILLGFALNAGSQIVQEGQDKLGETLENYKLEKVFINFQDQSLSKSIPIAQLKEGKVLVIYALSNPSSGYQWDVASYNKDVLTYHDIPLKDACEVCPAPGASVFQRIVFTAKGKGETNIELKYHRPWTKEKSTLNSCKIQVQSQGESKDAFEFESPVPKIKELKKEDYVVDALPSYFDWRDEGVVTPVKDQGASNGCWSFGSAAGFEAKIMMKDGVERDLSEQFLGACNEWGFSISGGGWWAHDLWWDVIPPGHEAAGAVYEEDLPYQYTDVECTPLDHHEQLEGWAYTDDVEDNPWPTMLHDPTTEQVKEKLIEWGPIPTALCTDDWGSYTGGVISGSTSETTTHIVMITGYDDANQCWIVKNSWGTDWGEDGYIRIRYGSHLCGQYSTYLKYDKTNPRLIYGGDMYYEAIPNDGGIRKPIIVKLMDAGDFAVTSGSLTEGTHYSISGLPSGLTPDIQVVNQQKVKIILNGQADSHVDADDTQIIVNFSNAAFADYSAASVEGSTDTLDIDFFDPYQIVYEDIEDQTVTTADVWKTWYMDGNTFGLWYSYYYYGDDVQANTFFFETYCRNVMCTTPGVGEHERMVKVVNYGETIDPLTEHWVLGGTLGEQHRMTNSFYSDWNGKTAYAGFQFKKYGSTVYGWVRFQVNSGGSSVTVLDYAYNEKPLAPITAGTQTEPVLVPVAEFTADVDETYVGVNIQLADGSYRVPTSWSWSMPGATPSSSSEQNPKITYNAPGTYNISLTVSNAAGSNTMTKNGIITVYEDAAPVVDFEPSATTVPQGASVKFYENCTNLPTSFAWTFNSGDPATSTDPNPASTFNSIGTFDITLDASNPYGSGSATKSISIVSVPSTQYCAATTSYSNPGALSIVNVKLANLNHTSGASATSYEDYRSQYASLDAGSSYAVTITPSSYWDYNALGIWIDWNQDGDFSDSGETIHTMNSTDVYEKTFTVPSSALTGMTCMRVRMHYSKDPFACGDDSYMTEAEDYTIIVNDGGTPDPDTTPPTVATNLAAANIAATSVDLSWTASYDEVGVTAYVVYKDGTEETTVGSPSASISGLEPSTTYQFTVVARDAAGNTSDVSAALEVNTLEDPGCTYCGSQGNSVTYEWIAGVATDDFTNSSGAAGYTDFTNKIIYLTAGASNAITLTPGFQSTAYTEYWNIWIDFNKDCDFEDADEELLSSSGSSTISGSIAIPATATGTTTMRISMKYNGEPTPCETFSYGEVEEYTVVFVDGVVDTTPPETPTGLAAANITTNSVDLSWNEPYDNVGVTGYDVIQDGATVESPTATSIYISGLQPSTTYRFRVKAKDAAGNVSDESNYVDVTTLDEVCTYCESVGNSTSYEWIAEVAIGSFSNPSDAAGYSDFTNQSIGLIAGASASVTLTPGFASSAYTEYWKIWIDFNDDCDFDDSGEELFSDNANAAVSGSISIPSSVSGTKRMRIAMMYNGAPASCGSYSYGETEDYTVNIAGSGGQIPIAGSFKAVLYPNPVSDQMTVQLYGAQEATIDLIRINGQIVSQTKISNSYGTIDVSHIPSGMYYVKIVSNERNIIEKIIVE